LELIITAVIGTLLGGIGRVFAAAAAAVFLGLLQSFSILIIDSRWQNLLLYGVLFITIVVFPRGVRLPPLRLIWTTR
jgi:branched-chain amino acid transport system permease protein